MCKRLRLSILNPSLLPSAAEERGYIRTSQLQQVPLAETEEQKESDLANIVSKILLVKKTNPSADTSALESEIDRLVYHLYSLTYDEVLIVDPETPITREEYENQK